ncbi:DUF1684 domain-containing protein [Paenarthrobacter sp. Z7-10]|uniref:DUF1684 domain-containing protein n=1 Tax=Paenarthrobacter sp. Z7-10 TaxID=2787635 RepID=UPI0022A941EE|nr:DUF1684 domain-containing protein [Paenarthrobacter sp. Z7-10]MCZ2402829.1 DUF1684 domain-containing protein [Paenarthrobacter sp. Z7-10]
MTQTSTAPNAAAPANWLRFRSSREAELTEEHGWLTLTSLQWLGTEPAPLDLLPGLWHAADGKAVLNAAAADGLVVKATQLPVDGTLTASLADEESLLWVQFGSIVVELARRGGHYAVRTRDRQSPVLTNFGGVPTFAYRPELVLTARFERYAEPRRVAIGTANPHVSGTAVVVGAVAFELNGTTHRLAAEADASGALRLTFSDASNGRSTAGWRKVVTAIPDHGGQVRVDFNRAVNYPSAFTPFGTCPMPVPGNTIGVPLEAGEMAPH